MDFPLGHYGRGGENILNFEENQNFNDGAILSDAFNNEFIPNESFLSNAETFSTVAESFVSADETFATVPEYPPEGRDHEFEEDGEFRERACVLTDGSDRFGVTCTVFDKREELIWSGNSGGHATSYFGPGMMKYTSFQVHKSEQVRDLQTINDGVLIATPTTLNMRSRQGLVTFNKSSPEFEEVQCVLPLSHTNRLLIGGHQNNLIDYDLNRLETVKLYDVGEDGCVILREHSRFILHGNPKGNIVLHDPRTLREENKFEAHTAALSDFDVQGNFVVSCGFTERHGHMLQDQFLVVFDLRMMKIALPLRPAIPPYFIRFIPGLSACVAVMSQMGQWVLMDVSQQAPMAIPFHVSLPPNAQVTSMDVSSSSNALIVGNNAGSVNLFMAGGKRNFNNFSEETLFASVNELARSIPIMDTTTSFGHIPMPIPTSPLLSHWPEHLMQNSYWPTPPIEPEILQAINMNGPIGYAQNLFNRKKNQVPYNLSSKGLKNTLDNNKDEVIVHVPRRYRRIEIKYNKMGYDEIDFDLYNRTCFSGLDMLLPNSYCNPVLQVFHYIEPLRKSLLSHLCEREFCLSCEFGFLFHMLDINRDQGHPCQASNFLRAFRTIPEASAMSLTVNDQDNRAKINFSSKMQSFNRFVMQQLLTETCERDKDTWVGEPSSDYKGIDKSPLSEIFGSRITNITKCAKCGRQSEADLLSSCVNLNFSTYAKEPEGTKVAFSTVVQNSMCIQQNTQAWCESCAKYQPMEQIRTYKSLPSVLSLNCCLENSQDLKFWQNQHEILHKPYAEQLKEQKDKNGGYTWPSPLHKQKIRSCRYGEACVRVGCRFAHPKKDKDPTSHVMSLIDLTMDYPWIPLGLKVSLSKDGSITVKDLSKSELDSYSDTAEDVYDLMGVVSQIADPKFPDKNNLVACIKVGASYHQRAGVSPVSNWYLFNDISIQAIVADEAVWFPSWKTPCILYWSKRGLPKHLSDLKVMNPITFDVFKEDKSLAQRSRKRITFSPLTLEEIPGKDEYIAMDAEFVNLHQEEAEIRSDGTRSTIKPSHKSLARITCIRGQGPFRLTPFMDDYISTQEQVVDYLTQFSGIKPGDLDANYSQKHLTTLKSTYIKLRYLIDQGVKIIGHGLKNDLRVINIIVPQNQLIDTVCLYHLQHHRMVSLKFLAWHFLKTKIQSITHDSIEDARTALVLYEKFLTFQKDNDMLIIIQDMYEVGKKQQWKVPGDDELE